MIAPENFKLVPERLMDHPYLGDRSVDTIGVVLLIIENRIVFSKKKIFHV